VSGGAGDGLRWIAFPVYPGVRALDLIGPLTVLRDLRLRSPYRAAVVGDELGRVPTDSDLALAPTRTFADLPAPWGVIVPGAGGASLDAMDNVALVDYVRAAARTASLVGSTGTGSLVLAAAGLLDGRRVATPQAHADVLARHGAIPVPGRWVRDDPLLTAAGGTAGIDALLDLVARITSPSRALFAQLAMEYDPQPPFGPLGATGRVPLEAASRAFQGGTHDDR
jgi:transcriptional regulator GlxA family with amidase domain